MSTQGSLGDLVRSAIAEGTKGRKVERKATGPRVVTVIRDASGKVVKGSGKVSNGPAPEKVYVPWCKRPLSV